MHKLRNDVLRCKTNVGEKYYQFRKQRKYRLCKSQVNKGMGKVVLVGTNIGFQPDAHE